ncbi:hypothetical protein INT43_006310, partial [Umbelopsis isabellina]
SATRIANRVRYQSFTSAAGSKSRLRPLPIALGALAGSSLTAFYFMNAVDYHPAALSTEEELLHHEKATKDVEELPIVKELRARDDVIIREAYGHLKGAAKLHNLTATTLRGKDKVVISPLVFYTNERKEVTIVVHLGRSLCGHDKIVHGGMLATLLDEALASVALPALPFNLGFTANLNIDYRLPVMADQWVVLRGKLLKQEGRKAWVEAWIESADGKQKFTEAKSLYIAPKAPF